MASFGLVVKQEAESSRSYYRDFRVLRSFIKSVNLHLFEAILLLTKKQTLLSTFLLLLGL